MTRAQIAKAARDAGYDPGEFGQYYALWLSAKIREIGLYVQFEPDEVDEAVRGLLRTKAICGGLSNMMLCQPPNLPGVVYLIRKPLEEIDETEPE
jgi:hypothetical protein